MTIDLDHLRTWIGRTETVTEKIGAANLAALSAALDSDELDPQAGDSVPPAGHWIYFTPKVKASNIGPDGHAMRGGFLPPVDLPRRMWAGGRIVWQNELRVDDVVTRTSTIVAESNREPNHIPPMLQHQTVAVEAL